MFVLIGDGYAVGIGAADVVLSGAKTSMGAEYPSVVRDWCAVLCGVGEACSRAGKDFALSPSRQSLPLRHNSALDVGA